MFFLLALQHFSYSFLPWESVTQYLSTTLIKKKIALFSFLPLWMHLNISFTFPHFPVLRFFGICLLCKISGVDISSFSQFSSHCPLTYWLTRARKSFSVTIVSRETLSSLHTVSLLGVRSVKLWKNLPLYQLYSEIWLHKCREDARKCSLRIISHMSHTYGHLLCPIIYSNTK